MLEAAACPVEQNLVVRIVVDRVIPYDAGVVAEPDGIEPAIEVDHHTSPEADEAASQLWIELSDDERLLLPHLRTPARQLEQTGMLDLKKSAIAARQARLEERVIEFVSSRRDGLEAMRIVLRWQEDWAAGRSARGEP